MVSLTSAEQLSGNSMRPVRITKRKPWLCSVGGDISQWSGPNARCKYISMNLKPSECMAHGNFKCDFKKERTEKDAKEQYKNHLIKISKA